jgi:hypothetical protein
MREGKKAINLQKNPAVITLCSDPIIKTGSDAVTILKSGTKGHPQLKCQTLDTMRVPFFPQKEIQNQVFF